MAKREKTPRRKSAKLGLAEQEALRDLDYAASGGWRTKVNGLIYLLRVCRGHWIDEASELERFVQTVKDLPPEEEKAALDTILNLLTSIRNQRKGDLAKEQRLELKMLIDEAIVRTRQRIAAIPDDKKKTDRALRRVKEAVEASLNSLASAPEPPSKMPPTIWHHKEGERSYSSDNGPPVTVSASEDQGLTRFEEARGSLGSNALTRASPATAGL